MEKTTPMSLFDIDPEPEPQPFMHATLSAPVAAEPAPVVAAPPAPTPASEPVAEERKSVEKMHASALVFLENPLARRLAAAWPMCNGTNTEWLDAAGVTVGEQSTALKTAAALKANGICRANGVTDELAMQYLAAIASEPIARMKARSNGGDKRK
jgi:hypothetical protein